MDDSETAASSSIESLFTRLRQQTAHQGNVDVISPPPPMPHPFLNQQQLRQPPGGIPVQGYGYHQPSVSSPIVSPPIYGPQPHSSNILSPNGPSPAPMPRNTSVEASNADRTNSLLNLLKFKQPAAPASSTSHNQARTASSPNGHTTSRSPEAPVSNDRTVSASDLVASFIGKSSPPKVEEAKVHNDRRIKSPELAASPTSGSENPQDLLLRLLSRPKPVTQAQTVPVQAAGPSAMTPEESASESLSGEIQESGVGGKSKRAPVSDVTNGRTTSPAPASKPSLFTYVNPFDQLAASSPRNRTPRAETPRSGNVTPNLEILKRAQEPIHPPNGEPASKRGKSSSPETWTRKQRVTSPPPASKLSSAVRPSQSETVADALTQVGEKVDKQVEDALLKAEREQNDPHGDSFPKIDKKVHDAAASVKKELEKEENRGALTEAMPKPVAETVKDVIDRAAADNNVADSWESAEGEDSNEESGRIVRVYNFPIRPFASINIPQGLPEPAKFKDDSILEIARVKKEFDQADRTLMASTSEYIVYAMAKNGGLRIIRQDDGKDRQIFRSTQDRPFHVAACGCSVDLNPKKTHVVLAIGLSGAVYWAKISDPFADLFETDNIENNALVFPPPAVSEDNTSGGQLKTRAKLSSRHPDYFAVGRGKSIYIIWVDVLRQYILDSKTRTVDTEKYLAEYALKISIGKAGKDFAFSRDDTLIVTLDKSGRLRFWDIRELNEESSGRPGSLGPKEISTPLKTLVTSSGTEKSWPTSVHFLDKARPYQKGTALRFLLVGFKQNHTIQLWDLAISKPVQEISFPHGNESDAICSIAYHAATGVIVVGHPSRNSIYFVHLSAPKYNLHHMSQARFMQRIAQGDPSLTSTDSTAIMSGVVEFSFSSKGELRSLDLLSSPIAQPEDEADPVLFELYVMHSKGSTCLKIKRADLGWDEESKVMHPVAAESEGLVTIDQLVNPVQESAAESQPPVTSDQVALAKIAPKVQQEPSKVDHDKPEKRRRRRGATKEEREFSPPRALRGSAPIAETQAKETKSSMKAVEKEPNVREATAESINLGVSGDFLDREMKKFETSVSAEMSNVVSRELEKLYRRFDDDRRVSDAAGAAKQEAILRLISSTLSDNVDKNLTRIVNTSVQQKVLPSVSEMISNVLERTVPGLIGQQIQVSIARELRQAIPEAINRAMHRPEFVSALSDIVASKVAGNTEKEVSRVVQASMSSIVQSQNQTKGAVGDGRLPEQIKHWETQRQADSLKIEQLSELVRGLSDTVNTMATAQRGFQNEILKLQQQIAQASSTPAAQSTKSEASTKAPSEFSIATTDPAPEDVDLGKIRYLMNEGRYEEGTIVWLQSAFQTELFDKYFFKLSPLYLNSLSPLVALSVGAAVSASFDENILERLMWLETVFASMNPMDSDIQEVAPKILDVLSQRLEGLYMQVAEKDHHHAALRKIPPLARKAKELKGLVP